MRYVLTIAGLLAAATALPVQAETDRDAVAECVVDNDLRDVRALLNTVPGSPEERRTSDRIMVYYGGCNDNKIMTGRLAWRERAEIANAALMARIGRSQFDAASASRDGWKLAMTSGKVAGTDFDAGSVSMRQFGDCIVTLAPVAAVQLARSARGSGDEAAAIATLAPTLNDCIAPGQNFRVKRADLRLIVAEPLYHLTSR